MQDYTQDLITQKIVMNGTMKRTQWGREYYLNEKKDLYCEYVFNKSHVL